MSDFNVSKKGPEPWVLQPNYKLTSQLWNSDKTIAKATRYTGVGVAVLAIAESIREMVKIPFKLVGNLFGLYKYPMFKAPILVFEEKSIDVVEKTSVWKKALYVTGALLGLGSLVYGGYRLYPFMPSIFSTKSDANMSPAFRDLSFRGLFSNFFPSGKSLELPKSTSTLGSTLGYFNQTGPCNISQDS